MQFEKWQACGNDFIIVREEGLNAPNVCDRHFGIGADGILIIKKSDEADAEMVVVNSDGSIAQMCGNGIRCVGRLISEEIGRDEVSIATGAGIKRVVVNEGGARVAMGRAEIEWRDKIELPGRVYEGTKVNMGNPHFVIEREVVRGGEVERFGRQIEKDREHFPEGVNVEFVVVESRKRVRVKVWERGAGRTLACGTGACAAAYALWRSGKVEPEVEVELDGGVMKVRVSEAGVEMTGPAERVYKGEIEERWRR